jgi:hypothetical protein
VGPISAGEILPLLRDLYSKYPEMLYLEPWELQSTLFVLGYVDELLGEWEIAAAVGVARKDFYPEAAA